MRAAVAAAAAALLLAGPAHACCRRTHLIPPGKQAGEVPLAIGDSVMMGAAPELAADGLEVDAKEGRVMHAALEILRRRRHVHTLPATVVLAIGTNIPVTTGELPRAARLAGDERVLAGSGTTARICALKARVLTRRWCRTRPPAKDGLVEAQ